MAAAPNIGKITFALVDVKRGREALVKIVERHKQKVPLTLTGEIVGVWGSDDGVSIEFEMTVTDQKVGAPEPHDCGCIRCHPERFKKKA